MSFSWYPRAAALLLLLALFLGCGNADPDPVTPEADAEERTYEPLEWEPYALEDSAALRPRGPYFTYRLSTLVAFGGDPELRRFINKRLTDHVVGSPVTDGGNLKEVMPDVLEQRFTDYREQELEEEWLQEAPHSFTVEEEDATEVVFQSDSLIVLAHSTYTYSGGAHGNYGTTLLAFATRPPRRLTPADLFRPGSEAELSRLLMARADSLTEGGLLVDSVPVTDNLAPLPGGVRFVYPPYEIAPYAVGEVVIDLPYAAVRPWLRPEVEKWVQ
ncbi:hypothetical protein GGR26_000187 [Lewinella marina]|uniref:DUF3298 domain-containing protein n=1 Tax=Neolewinella marina TaxID=438751 RepID=A0A2G0CK70_9BACT|nr:DUF3298 and DUF4163 domain-containing protein [Neolewinella marina]NJB84442.1 hypothetical protein [Neolewinella marina]PHL00365.1 hypothetical protein CGL56_04845 [Neolewinella marina]